MSESINSAVIAFARFTSSGSPYTPSPAPTCTVYRYIGIVGSPTQRVTVVSAQATFAEGGNTFSYTLASGSNTTVGTLEFAFTTSDTAADDATLSAWIEIVAASASAPTAAQNAAAVWDYPALLMTTIGSIGLYLLQKIGLIGTSAATVAQNPTPSGRITIYENHDYYVVDGTSPALSSTSPLNLATSTVVLLVQDQSFACTVSGSTGAWVITPTAMARTATVELADGICDCELRATLANGHIAPPIARGQANVVAEIS